MLLEVSISSTAVATSLGRPCPPNPSPPRKPGTLRLRQGPRALSARRACPSKARHKSSFFEFLDQFRDHLEQIAHDAVIGHLEDRRFLVLVDGDDHPAVLHPGQVLDGAGDADRDVELGGHDLSGMPYLTVVRHEARVRWRDRT